MLGDRDLNQEFFLRIAGEQGFDPQYYPSKGYVLPLDDSPAISTNSFNNLIYFKFSIIAISSGTIANGEYRISV